MPLPANLTVPAPHPYTGRVIIGSSRGLGFSVTSVAKGIQHVATNSRVQQAAAAAAQAYAPDQYSKVTYWADRARGIVAPPGTANVPMMPPPPPSIPDSDGPPVVGVQKNNFTPFIIGGGILVLAVLLLRR